MASLEAAAKSFNRFSSGDRKTLTALRYELPLLLLVSKVPQLGIQSRQGSWSPFQGGSMTSPQETSGNADLGMYQDKLKLDAKLDTGQLGKVLEQLGAPDG